MKKQVDYSAVRGFNYTQSNSHNDVDFWSHYDHDIIDRDMGYAERLQLNSARIFLPYPCYEADPDGFLANVKDFVRTAWKHGVSVNPIIFFINRWHPDDKKPRNWDGKGLPPLSYTVSDPSCWHIGEEYFDRLYETIGDEPGLLFWDISNEPGYTDNFVTWYDEEMPWEQDFRVKPDIDDLRAKQEKTWEFIRHLCKYVKSRDPWHDIGVGNIFITETEFSKTADLVDVIVFHDYSSTRNRVSKILDTAVELGKKYNKPVIDNEMCCLARANPYDMSIELHSKYGIGWYLFELMIGVDGWSRVHGVVYPDGTVRDPSIVAAIYGFYRNRGESAVRSDVDQEDFVLRAERLAERVLRSTRQSMRRDHSKDAEELLEVCEYIANLLEAGELVPMAYPPTAKIAAYRRMEKPDPYEIADYLVELIGTLKKSCRVVK